MKIFIVDCIKLFNAEIGSSRIKRILVCSLLISLYWITTDFLIGNLHFSLFDDLVCLLLGLAVESLIPWGKKRHDN